MALARRRGCVFFVDERREHSAADSWQRVAALSVSLAGLLASHSISAAQPLPTLPSVAVERDGDTFYVRARERRR